MIYVQNNNDERMKRLPTRHSSSRFQQHGKVTRHTRKSLNPTSVIELPERPGYHRRWINDVGDNVLRKLDNGYEPVTTETLNLGVDSRSDQPTDMGSTTITRVDKSGVNIVAMEIPIEWYNENQEEKKKNRMRNQQMLSRPELKDGQYVPSDDVVGEIGSNERRFGQPRRNMASIGQSFNYND